MLLVHDGAARRERFVDRVRILRRRQRPDPIADALQRGMIDGDRGDAGAERGAQVALVDRVVVAVPVQVHPLARLLIPQRGKVGCADQLFPRKILEPPVELNRFVRIERVDASAAPRREGRVENRRDAVSERERLDLETIDQPEPKQQTLEERGPVALVARASPHALGRRAIVERAVEDELHETLQIELVGGHAEHHARRRRRRIAHRARVTHGAIEPHVIDADPVAACHADRQLLARLVHEAERRVSAGELLRADRRQRGEHRVRRQHAADRL